jgi:hypothetical protein
MAVDRIRTGSQAMYNSLSFYPGVPSVSRSPPFARPHRAATPKIAVSPAVTHTLVGPTLLVRFARPSILEQDASTLIVSSHDPLTTGTNLSDANGSGSCDTTSRQRWPNHATGLHPLPTMPITAMLVLLQLRRYR